MTNQEAIEVIKLAQAQVEWEYPMDYATAFDMAISALQEQDSKTRICDTCKHTPPSKKWPCVDCDMREPADRWEPKDATDTNVGDTISRQAALDCVTYDVEYTTERIKALPPAQPEYEPVKAKDFAKTMSENTLYTFVAWHQEALTLMKELGFVICKKTM